MAEVAQAYFHFTKDLSATELRRFGRQIDRASKAAALRNFNTDVRIVVDIEDGSIIGRVTAITIAVSTITSLIANYKGVKDSVIEMCEDARSFGSDVCDKAIKFAKVTDKQIYRTERRTKTVGKVGRLVGDISRLEKSMNDLSPAQTKKELARISRALRQIKNDLQPAEQQALEDMIEQTQLPPTSKWPATEVHLPKVAVKPEQLELTYEAAAIEDRSKRRRIPLHYRSTFDVKQGK